jgi:hypothetical protein
LLLPFSQFSLPSPQKFPKIATSAHGENQA